MCAPAAHPVSASLLPLFPCAARRPRPDLPSRAKRCPERRARRLQPASKPPGRLAAVSAHCYLCVCALLAASVLVRSVGSSRSVSPSLLCCGGLLHGRGCHGPGGERGLLLGASLCLQRTSHGAGCCCHSGAQPGSRSGFSRGKRGSPHGALRAFGAADACRPPGPGPGPCGDRATGGSGHKHAWRPFVRS
jgi:hypothetical protein